MDNKKLQGSITLITGVGRSVGIGAAICREIAKNGGDIFFTYWHPYDAEIHAGNTANDPEKIATELRECGIRVGSAEIDLSSPNSAEKLFTMVEGEFGAPTILINNACHDFEIPFVDLTAEILDTHYAVNVRSVALLCSEFVKRGNAGHILNMTSGQSIRRMGEHKIPYTITKASLEMLAPQLAPELAKLNININSLDPGPTDTGWMSDALKEQIARGSKLGKVNTPQDIGEFAISILTQENPVTGQVIRAWQ